MELTGLQWIQVDINANQCIRSTESYISALIYANKKYKLLNWSRDVFEATLHAITVIHERNRASAIGKPYE